MAASSNLRLGIYPPEPLRRLGAQILLQPHLPESTRMLDTMQQDFKGLKVSLHQGDSLLHPILFRISLSSLMWAPIACARGLTLSSTTSLLIAAIISIFSTMKHRPAHRKRGPTLTVSNCLNQTRIFSLNSAPHHYILARMIQEHCTDQKSGLNNYGLCIRIQKNEICYLANGNRGRRPSPLCRRHYNVQC